MIVPEGAIVVSLSLINKQELSDLVFEIESPRNVSLELRQYDTKAPVPIAGHYLLDLVPHDNKLASVNVLYLGKDEEKAKAEYHKYVDAFLAGKSKIIFHPFKPSFWGERENKYSIKIES